jgi:phenylalanyl-tRNA synthetase alpha chain
MNIADLSLELSQVQIQDEHALEQFRIRFLGSKNVLKDLYAAIKDIPNDQKRAYGQQVNALKERAEQIFHEKKTALAQVQQVGAQQDHSRPARPESRCTSSAFIDPKRNHRNL